MGDIKRTSAAEGRPSGRFLLRIPPGLHAALKRAASEAGVSLNDYCVRKLTAPVGDLSSLEGASLAVLRAASLVKEKLIGIAAFGSWARRQAATGSDVDLLIVVDDFNIPLGTYRLRPSGSAGGHNGLKSIEAALQSQEYARLRVGIGPLPAGEPWEDFVLGPFDDAEREQADGLMPDLLRAVDDWLRQPATV